MKGQKIKQIATKGDFVLALSEEGELFGWGNNEYNQLSMSLGSATSSEITQIGVSRHLKLPSVIKRPLISIAASGTHCLAIDANYQVWVWGHGLLGRGPKCEQLSRPERIPATLFGICPEIPHSMDKQPVKVYCGLNSSAVLLNDGNLFMWGKNKYGNLGLNDDLDAFIPLRVSIPARVVEIDCGPDQTFAICRTNL